MPKKVEIIYHFLPKILHFFELSKITLPDITGIRDVNIFSFNHLTE